MNIDVDIVTIQQIAHMPPPITDERLLHVTNAVQVLKQDLENILASVTDSKNSDLASLNNTARTTITREGKGSPTILKRRALMTKTRSRPTNTTQPVDSSESCALENGNGLVKPLVKKDLFRTSSGGVTRKIYSPSKTFTGSGKPPVKKTIKSTSLNTLKRSTAVGTTTLSRATRSTTSVGIESIRRMR